MRYALQIALILVGCGLATPAAAQGIKFSSDIDGELGRAKKESKLVIVHFTQKESPGCVALIKNVFNNMDGAAIAKKYVAVKVSADEEKGQNAFRKFNVRTTPTVMILSPQGNELLQKGLPNLNEFTSMLDTAGELQAGLDALSKVKNDSPSAMIAALKKIGAIEAGRSRTTLCEHAENENLPESVRRVALENLGRQKESAGDLVPFLGEKIQGLRLIAFNALKTMGPQAMPALLDGLESTNADQRSNCFALAYPHTKLVKITRDATFWKTAKPDMREPAVKAWKEWWEKNKPNMN